MISQNIDPIYVCCRSSVVGVRLTRLLCQTLATIRLLESVTSVTFTGWTLFIWRRYNLLLPLSLLVTLSDTPSCLQTDGRMQPEWLNVCEEIFSWTGPFCNDFYGDEEGDSPELARRGKITSHKQTFGQSHSLLSLSLCAQHVLIFLLAVISCVSTASFNAVLLHCFYNDWLILVLKPVLPSKIIYCAVVIEFQWP